MKILIFASGYGSNAEAIMNATQAGGKLEGVEIAALASDNPDARALQVAKSRRIKAVYLNPERRGARFTPSSEKRYNDFVLSETPDLVVLAGFMRILPDSFVGLFGKKTINLHPSLLPAYKGKDSIKRAFEAGETKCGCTVHYVSSELDGGEIIAQREVEIAPSDTLETVEAKVHAAEHILLVDVVADIAKKHAANAV